MQNVKWCVIASQFANWRGNLQCTWMHRTKMEEKFTPGDSHDQSVGRCRHRPLLGLGMTRFLDCAVFLQNAKCKIIIFVDMLLRNSIFLLRKIDIRLRLSIWYKSFLRRSAYRVRQHISSAKRISKILQGFISMLQSHTTPNLSNKYS